MTVDNPETGVTYYWSTGETGNSIVVTQAGSYTCYGDNGNCQSDNSNEVAIDVNPLPDTPNITVDDADICEGESATLSIDNPETGVTYHWSTGETGNSIVVTAAGTYTCYGDNGECQSDNSNEVEVFVHPLPVVDFSSDVQYGEAPLSVHFEDSSTGDPVSWLWNFGDGGTSTLQNPNYTYDVVGVYDVSLVVETAYGCSGEIVKEDFIDVFVGIKDDFARYNISYYPNPTKGMIYFDFGSNDIQELTVMDITGKTLFESRVTGASEKVDISGYDAGVYFISVKTNDLILTTKIVKE